MLVGAVGALPPIGTPCGSALGDCPGVGFPAFASGGAVPACKTVGTALAPVPGGSAGAFGPPGWITFLTTCFEV